MCWSKLWRRHRRIGIPVKTYNCARLYRGSYAGGDTNEFEKLIVCNYTVLSGEVSEKKLRPVLVRGTNSEETSFKLEIIVVYPKTDTAMISATNGKRTFKLGLVKVIEGKRSTIFKMRL